jgi:hypothetical protein
MAKNHFYTTGCDEARNAQKVYGYKLDGIAGYVHPLNEPSADTVVLYRMLQPTSGEHFYTTDRAEMLNTVAKNGYRLEDPAALVASKHLPGTVPLYRSYNATLDDHFYTTNLKEKNAKIEQGWKYEQIAAYVWSSGKNPCGNVSYQRAPAFESKACEKRFILYKRLFIGHPELSTKSVFCLPFSTWVIEDIPAPRTLDEVRKLAVAPIQLADPNFAQAYNAFRASLPRLHAGDLVTVISLYDWTTGKQAQSVPPNIDSPDPLGRDRFDVVAKVKTWQGEIRYTGWSELEALAHAWLQ